MSEPKSTTATERDQEHNHQSLPVVSAVVCRAALIDATARAIRENEISCTGPGEVACRGIKGWHSWSDHRQHVSEAAVDAVLPLIADAIEDRIGFGEMSQHMFGLSDAARVVRSFAEETS